MTFLMAAINALLLRSVLFYHCFGFCILIDLKRQSDPLTIRKTSSGLVRGRKIPISFPTASGDIFLFAAIPYARAPLDDLRFSLPQPQDTWEGVRDATELGPSCWWNVSAFPTDDPSMTPMNEDCLLVNVFVSERCLRLGGCAVFHYIYGGQFMFGTARKLDEQTIAENFCSYGREVIVVTFGYRMNVFGLLNLNFHFPDLNPPNLAIHDIVASLIWTQKEIGKFGGDNKRVTLAGHSSGSVATQILMLLPRTNVLFHQTISMSGPGTIEMLPNNKNERASRRLAVAVGCVTVNEGCSTDFWTNRKNILRVMQCLRGLPARRLAEMLPLLQRESILFHGLALESGPDSIINDTFVNLLGRYSGKHKVMTGTVSKEFLDGMSLIKPDIGQLDKVRLTLYCRRLVRQLNYERQWNALLACIEEYDDVRRAPFLFDDANMFVPHLLFATDSVLRNVPTFLYQFEYDAIGAAFQFAPGRFGSSPGQSPGHAQELVYLFGQNKGIFAERDQILKQFFSALFVNFILSGTLNGGPIQNALPFEPNRSNFYRVDFTNVNNRSIFVGDTARYHWRAVKFWTEQMPKVAGRRHLLRDELLIDDQMLSKYMWTDLRLLERLLLMNRRPWTTVLLPWLFNWTVSFVLSMSLLLILLLIYHKSRGHLN